MNKAILSGRLGIEPELNHTGGGTAVLKLRLATNDRIKRAGEWVTDTQWHTVLVWGGRGESLAKLLHKGDAISVVGRISTRSWTDKEGAKRLAVEVHADDVELFGDGNHGKGRQAADEHASAAPF